MVRKHYIFHGRVQGVGFRVTLYQACMRLKLTGWVRNLYDGTVEACIQGDPDKIEQAIGYMYNTRYIRITQTDVEDISVLPSEKSFDMKY